MTNIVTFPHRPARIDNISRAHPGAIVIILPCVRIERTDTATEIKPGRLRRDRSRYVSPPVSEQMRARGLFVAAEGGDA